ncbi:MAG: TolC family protein [Endozoicomonas sp.]
MLTINGLKKAVPLTSALLAACSVTPVPITNMEHKQRVAADISTLYVDQEQVTAPVTLHEAIARSIKYNLDHRLKVMESALANKMFAVSKLDLLPKAGFSAGYTERSNEAASSSRSLATGQESLVTSTSQDKDRRIADLGITWNVLDFGVSYYRAQQQADRWLIAQERRRKVIHNIIQEVRSAYWRAHSADRVLHDLDPLLVRVEKALKQARTVERKKLKPPVEALSYQSRLLSVLSQLHEVRRNLMTAKTQLASLMNLPAGTEYRLANGEMSFTPKVDIPMEELERQALEMRPELREEGYNDRISALEVKRTMASLMPSLQFNTSYNYDSNSYNENSNWAEFSALIVGDLMDVVTIGDRMELAEAQGEVVKTRRMALSMAVMTQVHVAMLQYHQSVDAYSTAMAIDDVEQKILGHMKASRATRVANEQELIEAELKAILAELKKGDSFARLQSSYGNIFLSIGADPLPETVASHDLKTLSNALRQGEEAWRNWTPMAMPEAGASIANERADERADESFLRSVKAEASEEVAPLEAREEADKDESTDPITSFFRSLFGQSDTTSESTMAQEESAYLEAPAEDQSLDRVEAEISEDIEAMRANPVTESDAGAAKDPITFLIRKVNSWFEPRN